MKVILSADLFEDTPPSLKLHHIADMAFEGRHRLFIFPDDSPRFHNWLDQQELSTREQWKFALEASTLYEPLSPAALSIRVSPCQESDFTRSPPNLKIEDALALLTQPFRILVENSRNDAAFLERLATPHQREELKSKISAGYVRFEHGGGIGEIAKQLGTPSYTSPDAPLRTFVLTDSDALAPGEPSAQVKTVEQLCQRNRILSHHLKRRNIENYLPISALHTWSGYGPDGKQLMKAFKSLTADQRAHFNMKRGFAGDQALASSGTLYSGLCPATISALNKGFGRDVAECYSKPDWVKDEHLDREGIRQELTQVISTLIKLLR